MKKILLSLFACLIFLFSACSPDGGQNENNSSFTVTEVGDAVADAIKGSKAVMPNTQGVTAYQMSSRVLPSDVSIDEMLLDLMKNNEFVKAYYEAFSSVEEVESISHETVPVYGIMSVLAGITHDCITRFEGFADNKLLRLDILKGRPVLFIPDFPGSRT